MILLAALALAHEIERLLGAAPYIFPALLGTGALLAWRFRRSRALFALLLLGLATLAAGEFGLPGATGLALQATALLLPLNLALLAFLDERGVLTPRGLLRLGVIGGQVVLVAALVIVEPAPIVALLESRLTPLGLVERVGLSEPALLATMVAFAAAQIRLWFRPDPVTRGVTWMIPSTFLALAAAAGGGSAIPYLSVATLMIAISILEASFAMAYRDGLTGLPSRRAFNEELLRLGSRYTIAMVDVDHFKRCNDRYGHDVGDQVLRMVATRLGEVGGGGRAFRYGGEEFAILFPGKELAECKPHLEGVREKIKATTFTLRAPDRPRRKPKEPRAAKRPTRTISVTVSIGAAERTERLAEPDAVIKAADRALYRAKRGGRDRVVA